MKTKNLITVIVGLFFLVMGIFWFSKSWNFFILPPALIGAALIYLGFKRGRTAGLVFGHITIVIGCFYTTWGLLLLPYSEPTVEHVFGRPLFWGLFSIFGGICAIYHSFCRCLKDKEYKNACGK